MTYILDIPSTSTAAGRRVDLWFVRTNRASGTLIRTNGVWELVVGQAVTGASYAAVNSTYSAMEASAGTISGNPAIVLASGYGSDEPDEGRTVALVVQPLSDHAQSGGGDPSTGNPVAIGDRVRWNVHSAGVAISTLAGIVGGWVGKTLTSEPAEPLEVPGSYSSPNAEIVESHPPVVNDLAERQRTVQASLSWREIR